MEEATLPSATRMSALLMHSAAPGHNNSLTSLIAPQISLTSFSLEGGLSPSSSSVGGSEGKNIKPYKHLIIVKMKKRRQFFF